jgi:hypothetical protein
MRLARGICPADVATIDSFRLLLLVHSVLSRDDALLRTKMRNLLARCGRRSVQDSSAGLKAKRRTLPDSCYLEPCFTHPEHRTLAARSRSRRHTQPAAAPPRRRTSAVRCR